MDWVSDYVDFCLDAGFLGLALLALPLVVGALVALWVAAGLIALGRAFAGGVREGVAEKPSVRSGD